MKAISLRAPWWWLVIYGGKDIENRSRGTSYRGPVLIHASSWWEPNEVKRTLDFCPASSFLMNGMPPIWLLRQRGAHVVGVVDLVDVVTESASPWFRGRFGYVLENPRQLDPCPAAGRLGLFELATPRQLQPI